MTDFLIVLFVLLVGIPAVSKLLIVLWMSYFRGNLSESYSQLSSSEAINGILAKYSDNVRVGFYDEDCVAKITDSSLVSSAYDRLLISSILSRTEGFRRQPTEISAEWRMHNVCYRLGIKKSSARDVDIDYVEDPRKIVRVATKILRIIGWS